MQAVRHAFSLTQFFLQNSRVKNTRDLPQLPQARLGAAWRPAGGLCGLEEHAAPGGPCNGLVLMVPIAIISP